MWNRINKTLEAASKAAEPDHKELPAIVVKPLHQKPLQRSQASTPASEQPAPRPTIKLKVGGAQVKPTEKGHEKPEKPVEKPADISKASQYKAHKPKIPDEAPPPYVDDGSHDLLQEVIAIEREKDEEKRQRKMAELNRESPPSKASGSGPPGKRRKPNIEGDEDDVLAFTTPSARKEKPAAPTGRSTPVPERAAPAPKTIPAPPPKSKKKAEPAPAPAPAPEAPSVSIKGKEREVNNAQPMPSRPRATSSVTSLNEKKCRDVLRIISKLPEYLIFGAPVDPVKDGCPT